MNYYYLDLFETLGLTASLIKRSEMPSAELTKLNPTNTGDTRKHIFKVYSNKLWVLRTRWNILKPAIFTCSATLGVETMEDVVYYGVKAETKPRQIFSPFNIEVPMEEARGYAWKPFGGALAPWYWSAWSKGEARSNGGEIVDPNTPQRYDNNFAAAPRVRKIFLLPNYSRYPGDPLGMNSSLPKCRLSVGLGPMLT
ncbi:MAG: hypothetical protein R2827_01140 [Bdellovibrionales bacterium]